MRSLIELVDLNEESDLDVDIITRKIDVNGIELSLEYHPDGILQFYARGYNGECKLTNAGAFTTIGAVINALREINPEKIVYSATGNEREKRIKEKLYERKLRKLGYKLVKINKDDGQNQYFWGRG